MQLDARGGAGGGGGESPPLEARHPPHTQLELGCTENQETQAERQRTTSLHLAAGTRGGLWLQFPHTGNGDQSSFPKHSLSRWYLWPSWSLQGSPDKHLLHPGRMGSHSPLGHHGTLCPHLL